MSRLPSLERNLRLIPLHELLVWSSPWGAVFVLFTRAGFGIDGAVRLAAIYYLSVVAFEVPSGWASDRLGRVPTLRVASAAWVAAFTCFALGQDRFAVVALGQVFLAIGYASLSGTDSTFHFDTLEALGRAEQYATRQARVVSRGRAVGATGFIVGGALGLIDLRLGFVMSLALALAQMSVTLMLREPPRSKDRRAAALTRQLRDCGSYLRNIALRWLFGYGIALVVLEHVASAVMAPWMSEVAGEPADDLGMTPLYVGLTMAAMGLIGAIAAHFSVTLARRLGVRATLVGVGVLSAVIVTAMAWSQHWIVLALVVLRSVQGATAPILITAAIVPVVAQQHRATLLSLNSLAGRGLWGAVLWAVSLGVEDDVIRVLGRLAAVSWVLVALTLATAGAVGRRHGPAQL